MMNKQRKSGFTRRYVGAVLGAGAIATLVGCGGGGGGGNNNSNANTNIASANIIALTDNNRLIGFNSRTPNTVLSLTLSGVTAGDTLRGIDNRFAPPSTITATTPLGLYALGVGNGTQQLYNIAISGTTATATPIGARVDLGTTGTSFGLDFNPMVDRLRVVEAAGNRNARINPNTGANFDDPALPGTFDGDIVYDPSDVNAAQDPQAVGAAYTNVDQDTATGTVLYVLDANRNTLTIQGRADDPATPLPADETVSPNSGRLFTVAQIGIDIGPITGFDIQPGSNAGILVSENRVYQIGIAPGTGRGVTTGGARLRVTGGGNVVGIAIVQ